MLSHDADQPIVRDVDRDVYLVNKRVFKEESYFRKEMSAIFDTSWLYLGHETEIPDVGDFVTRRVAGRPVLFVRGSDGKARAFLNTCTHNGAMVCREAAGNRKNFACAYHGWVFDRDGVLVDVPGEAAFGPRFSKSDNGLISAPSADSYAGFVFISYARRSDLVDYLSGAAEYLDLLNTASTEGLRVLPGTHLYGSRSNWKMQMINANDGSHFMPTHATYLQYLREAGTDMESLRDFHEEPLGNGHTVYEYEAPWGRPNGKPDKAWDDEVNAEVADGRRRLIERLGPELGDRIARKNRNLSIFPNLIINDIVGTTIRVLEPISCDYVEASAYQLAPREGSARLAHLRTSHFLTFLGPGGFATPDDIECMESSQRGFTTYKEAPWLNYSKGLASGDRPNYITPGDSDLLTRVFFDAWSQCLANAGEAATRQ